MGKTEVNFQPKGHGDYAATLKSFDMSGPWELTVDASQGYVTAHQVVSGRLFSISEPVRTSYSVLSASLTSTLAARPAGNTDAITAAAKSTTTDTTSGNVLGICRDGK